MGLPAPQLSSGSISSKKLLGEVLIEMGHIDQAGINEAVKRGVQKKMRMGELLVHEGLITPTILAQALAIQFGLEFQDLSSWSPSAEAARLIPEKIARSNLLLPIELRAGVLVISAYDPVQFVKLESLKRALKIEFVLKVSPRQQIESALEKAYAGEQSVEGIVKHLHEKQAKKNVALAKTLQVTTTSTSAASVEALVNKIIDRGVADRASDIHIDPAENKARVRLRVDGILHELHSYPIDLHLPIVSRLKILARLDIAERRNAQDGGFGHRCDDGREVDIRLSTLPTIRGEKLVLRVLDKNKLKGTLSEIGMSRELVNEVQNLLQRPYGMIFITGPTGSGKTTTLYSMLGQINALDTNIITVEDPVEFKFDIINQVQVNEKAGLNFSGVLRNILRQDPDVLMIGEVRDTETAEIAIRSALTGHLVLSTLHTNDSVSTPGRLIDMDIEPYLLSSALIAVIAQRLVRVLCTQCRRKAELSEHEALLLNTTTFAAGSAIYEPVGCDHCLGSGYKNRIALYELMIVDAPLQKMIIDRRSEPEMLEHLTKNGFTSMRQDGIYKIAAGLTSVDEVLRATM